MDAQPERENIEQTPNEELKAGDNEENNLGLFLNFQPEPDPNGTEDRSFASSALEIEDKEIVHQLAIMEDIEEANQALPEIHEEFEENNNPLPLKPKKYLSAYLCFISELKKKGNPCGIKEASHLWGDLSNEQKEPYINLSKQLKEQYNIELEEYKQTLASRGIQSNEIKSNLVMGGAMKFPISRVKYKIKLGINDNHRISNEGIIIAEQAVRLFIEELSLLSKSITAAGKRKTIYTKDISLAIHNVPKLQFFTYMKLSELDSPPIGQATTKPPNTKPIQEKGEKQKSKGRPKNIEKRTAENETNLITNFFMKN